MNTLLFIYFFRKFDFWDFLVDSNFFFHFFFKNFHFSNLDPSSTLDHNNNLKEDPDTDFFSSATLINERNHRAILLYGTGQNKSNLQKANDRLCRQLTKALFRYNLPKVLDNGGKSQGSSSINSSKKVSGSSSFENLAGESANNGPMEVNQNDQTLTSELPTTNETQLEQNRLKYAISELYKRPIFDRTAICCQAVKYILSAIDKFVEGKGESNNCTLPSVHGIVRLMSLLDNVCFAPQILMYFVARLSFLLKSNEKCMKKFVKESQKNKDKDQKDQAQGPLDNMVARQEKTFTRFLALNCASVYRQYHSIFVIEAADSCALQKVFDGFWQIASNSKPNECSSGEMNMFLVLFEMWVTCRKLLMKHILKDNKKYPDGEGTVLNVCKILGWPDIYNNPVNNQQIINQGSGPGKNDKKIDTMPRKSVFSTVIFPNHINPPNQLTDSLTKDAKNNNKNAPKEPHLSEKFAKEINNPSLYINRYRSKNKGMKGLLGNFTEDPGSPLSSNERALNRYTFITNIIIKVCSGTLKLDHITNLAALAADMTSYSGSVMFTNAWNDAISVILSASCSPIRTNGNWVDILMNVDFSNGNIYEPLATLISCLIARGVITFSVFNHHAISCVFQLLVRGGSGSTGSKKDNHKGNHGHGHGNHNHNFDMNRKQDLDSDHRALIAPKLALYLLVRVYSDSCPLSSSYHTWLTSNYTQNFDGAKIEPYQTLGTSGITSQADKRLLAARQTSTEANFLFAICKTLVMLSDKLAPENNHFGGLGNRQSRHGHNSNRHGHSSMMNLKNQNHFNQNPHFSMVLSPVTQYSSHFCGLETNKLTLMFKNKKSFGQLTRRVMKLITAQQCVKECLITATFDKWIGESGLDEPCLDARQKQILIQHFLYPRRQLKDIAVPNPFDSDPYENLNMLTGLGLEMGNSYELPQKEYLESLVSHTNLWNMRQTILELKVMHKIVKNPSTVPSQSGKPKGGSGDDRNTPSPTSNISMERDISLAITEMFNTSPNSTSSDLDLIDIKIPAAWLVSYLVQNLDPSVQKAIWDRCKSVLQEVNGVQKLSAPQPFLLLILDNSIRGSSNIDVLLKTIIEHIRDVIEDSKIKLQKALLSANLANGVPSAPIPPEDVQKSLSNKQTALCSTDSLPLRLSLIGGLLDAVFSKPEMATEITKLLVTLIANGLVSQNSNSQRLDGMTDQSQTLESNTTTSNDLFYTTYDMLAVILWNYLGGDCPELLPDDFIKNLKKFYQVSKKAIINETKSKSENYCSSILQKLINVQTLQETIITYESNSIAYDVNYKTAKISPEMMNHYTYDPYAMNSTLSTFSSQPQERKNRPDYMEFGLKYSGYKIINPWDIVQGVKPYSGLHPSWFASRNVETNPSFWDQERRLIKTYYNHCGRRHSSYFKDPPKMEDLCVEDYENGSDFEEGNTRNTHDGANGEGDSRGGDISDRNKHQNKGLENSPVQKSIVDIIGMSPGQQNQRNSGNAGSAHGHNGQMSGHHPSQGPAYSRQHIGYNQYQGQNNQPDNWNRMGHYRNSNIGFGILFPQSDVKQLRNVNIFSSD